MSWSEVMVAPRTRMPVGSRNQATRRTRADIEAGAGAKLIREKVAMTRMTTSVATMAMGRNNRSIAGREIATGVLSSSLLFARATSWTLSGITNTAIEAPATTTARTDTADERSLMRTMM